MIIQLLAVKQKILLLKHKIWSSYTPDNAFLKKLMKSGILKQVLQLAKFKASNNLKKMMERKR